ncbi:unnamed protein product [Didymodactylos carnosus]|uniref:Uncharacterized protein n=1 Tax=Didymodactylos carnosus TaxID=1234261 RepID=A0A814BA90_9BILA|nr:unnamed protein product [Didymodactylos carnosus]CAF0925154.1 unnamed protein product [Didymodactylos carnosus]CAF3504985.1 unnamed protein product [Didymodactylos carnosus]CAF3703908.1 unnamed protein product [Didymodactylos carnosus]
MYQILAPPHIETEMATTANSHKDCWPELIGKDGTEAAEIIKQESGLTKVQLCGPNSRLTRDVQDDRVRVSVDENNKVTAEPTIG